ncbi:MAG: hypothetical protein AAF720_10240 [Pseudomonadota bacterium]
MKRKDRTWGNAIRSTDALALKDDTTVLAHDIERRWNGETLQAKATFACRVGGQILCSDLKPEQKPAISIWKQQINGSNHRLCRQFYRLAFKSIAIDRILNRVFIVVFGL